MHHTALVYDFQSVYDYHFKVNFRSTWWMY